MDNYNTQENAGYNQQASSNDNLNQENNTNQAYNNQTPAPYTSTSSQQPAPKPDSNLIWAILTTILCCMPLGIVSIVYAAKVDSLWYAGRQQEAIDAAKSAGNWAIWSAVAGIVIGIIYFVLGCASATLPVLL